jgi:hypothetical protein
VPPAETESWTPEIEQGPAIEISPVAAAAPAPIKLQSSGAPSIRLKDEPAAFSSGPARAESRSEPDQMSAAYSYEPAETDNERPLPWKLMAAGVVLIVVAYAITKIFLPSDIPVPKLSALKPVVEAVKKAPPPAVMAGSGSGGHLTVTTEPDGARVLLDGKAVGSSPLTLDGITPGRHVVTVQGAGGTIKRTVRIEPGKTLTIDVPVFSGFVVISAPIVVEVAENGKTIGTSQDQIILGAGHHDLHVSNKDLNYSAALGAEVEPGETTRLTLDPRGRANINAVPWAEILIDGVKEGDTPLANVAIRLGVREITFRNPQFPEKKITVTIKFGEPATITVDFAKDKVQ